MLQGMTRFINKNINANAKPQKSNVKFQER